MRARLAPICVSISGVTVARVWPSLGSSPRAGSGVAGQRLGVGDEQAALGAIERGGERHLDAELVRAMGLVLADAFDLRRVQGKDLLSALMLTLLAHPAGAHQRAQTLSRS